MSFWLLVILLAVTTYLTRAIGAEIMIGREMSSTMRLYFNYVPIGIITAIIIKQVIASVEGELVISIPVLIGCLTTAFAIKKTRMFLLSIVVGVVVGLAVRYFFLFF